MPMPTPQEALLRLREGNERYRKGRSEREAVPHASRAPGLLEGQRPFAVVLGCSDSRVPPEILFDLGPGDLFVIRVAGQVVDPAVVGSIEFAVDRLGSRLVVVLGHSECGAVAATLEAARGSGGELTPGLEDVVRRIRPAVDPLFEPGDARDPDAGAALAATAVRAHVRATVGALRRRSGLLAERVRSGEVRVDGGVFSLASGAVDFL